MAGGNPVGVYCGDFDVEGDEFDLRAERLIIFADELRFRMSGFDYFGHFTLDGVATRDPGGGFDSPQLEAKYEGDDRYAIAHVSFVAPRISPGRLKCEIRGIWRHSGIAWKFSGGLKPFVAKSAGSRKRPSK